MYLLTQAMVESQSIGFSKPVTLDHSQGLQYSKYGLGMSVLAIPFYLLGKGLAFLFGIEASLATQFAVSMINSLFTALSCLLIFKFGTERFHYNLKVSLFLALGFGLSTIAWYYSEDFMSEPATTFFMLSAVFFVTNASQTKKDLIWTGVFLALAVSCRSAVLVAIPGFVLYQWMLWSASEGRGNKELVEKIFLPAIPVIAVILLIMAYNYLRFGDVLETGYEKVEGRFLVGLFGILFSPGKSLFLFNPLALFGCMACMLFWRKSRKTAFLFLWIIFSHLILFSSWWSWQGGMGWGPRFMLVVLPYFILPVGLLFPVYKQAIKIPVFLMLFLGIIIQLPSVTVNVSRYYYEMQQKFGSLGHDRILFSPQHSQLVGQFTQVVKVFENLDDEFQMANMVSLAKKGQRFVGADIKIVLENGLAVNAPNFWWYYMHLFGYPFYFWLLPPVFLLGIIGVSGYQLYRATS